MNNNRYVNVDGQYNILRNYGASHYVIPNYEVQLPVEQATSSMSPFAYAYFGRDKPKPLIGVRYSIAAIAYGPGCHRNSPGGDCVNGVLLSNAKLQPFE